MLTPGVQIPSSVCVDCGSMVSRVHFACFLDTSEPRKQTMNSVVYLCDDTVTSSDGCMQC